MEEWRVGLREGVGFVVSDRFNAANAVAFWVERLLKCRVDEQHEDAGDEDAPVTYFLFEAPVCELFFEKNCEEMAAENVERNDAA